MTKRDDGGSAFPVLAPDSLLDSQYQPGMTLRDWFAGQALIGIISDDRALRSADGMAAFAYKVADEMIAERKR